jgi:putative ABC transport system permease protein
VVHIHSGGNSIFQTAFLNAADARALYGIDNLTSFFLVDLKPAADPALVARRLGRALPRTATYTSYQFAHNFADRVNAGFLAVVGVLVGIGLVVGGAVIALTTYTATVEKARDFGVLKAVGASGSFVYRIVIWQSLLVGLTGSLVGIGVSALAVDLIGRWVPEFVTDLRTLDVAGVFGVAMLMSIAASYVPVHRLNRIDPAMVFRA